MEGNLAFFDPFMKNVLVRDAIDDCEEQQKSAILVFHLSNNDK